MSYAIDADPAATADLDRLETKLEALKETTERELDDFKTNMGAGLAKASATTKKQLAKARSETGEGLDKVRTAMKEELDKAVAAAREELAQVSGRLAAQMANMQKDLDAFGTTTEPGRPRGGVREEPADTGTRLAALKAKLKKLKNATQAELAKTEKKLDEMDRKLTGMDKALAAMGAGKEAANAKLDALHAAVKTNQDTLAAAEKSSRKATKFRLNLLKLIGGLLAALLLARMFGLI